MPEQANGNQSQLPTIKVAWDAVNQQVGVQWDSTQFKNPEFILAILETAKQQVEALKRQMQIAAMQQHAAEQAQARALKRNLQLG